MADFRVVVLQVLILNLLILDLLCRVLEQVAHLGCRARLGALVRPGYLEQVEPLVLQELAERLEALALPGLLEPVGHQEQVVRLEPAEPLELLERLEHQEQVGRLEPAGRLVGLELQEPAERRGRLELVVHQGCLEFQGLAAFLEKAARQEFLAPVEHPEQVELLAFLGQAARQEQPVLLERPVLLGPREQLEKPGPQVLPVQALEQVQVRQREPEQVLLRAQALEQVLLLEPEQAHRREPGQVHQQVLEQAPGRGLEPALEPVLGRGQELELERSFLPLLLRLRLFLDHLQQQRLHLGRFRLQRYFHCSEFLEKKSVLKAL